MRDGRAAHLTQGGTRETPRLFHEIDQQEVGLAPGQDNPEEEVSGVRYNLETVDHILDNDYQLQATLTALNDEFDEAGTPPLDRDVEAFPPSSVAIKPVYAIIAAEGLTPLPVWDGPGGKDQSGSGPSTWTVCVLVDPPSEQGGGTASGDCNGTVGDLAVFDLDDFYHFTLTDAEIESLQATDGCIGCYKAKAGDYAAFLAMHVTTREIERWTWQTFWWIPGDFRSELPSSLPDPPAEVTGVWRSYTGCTAYSMVLPPQPITGGSGAGTEQLLCYNPYLEPGLGAPVIGVQTNCMACHANANWAQGTATTVANAPAYVNDMYVDLGGEQFADVARVDFLWSVADTAIED